MNTVCIVSVPVGPMGNVAYVIGDERSKLAAVVDPGWEPHKIIATLHERGWKPVMVLLTHSHFDHVREMPKLLQQHPVPVLIHGAEREWLPELAVEVRETRDGDEITLGDALIRCHHLPGHSPGGQCFEITEANALITGDTLFVDAIGRTDLPGSDADAMQASLAKLAQFPEYYVIYPGHDYGRTPTATIGEQKKTNPFLK